MKHLIILFSLLVLITSCKKEGAPAGAASAADSTEESNKAKFREAYDIINSGNFDGLDKLVATDFVEHTPWPGQEPGLAGLKKGFTEFKTAFPDLKITLNEVWAEGDIVIAHIAQTGTMTGAMGPTPASGKPMNIKGVDIVRIKDGKAVEHWGYAEEMKMAQQMGWMPPMDGGGEASSGGGAKKKAPAGTPKSQAPEFKEKH